MFESLLLRRFAGQGHSTQYNRCEDQEISGPMKHMCSASKQTGGQSSLGVRWPLRDTDHTGSESKRNREAANNSAYTPGSSRTQSMAQSPFWGPEKIARSCLIRYPILSSMTEGK